MPRAALANVSLKQLVAEIQRRKTKLADLLEEREAINEQIAELQTLAEAESPASPAPAVAKTWQSRLRATGQPLAEYVREVLAKASKGMSVKEIEAKVRKAGYPTTAESIYNPIMKVLASGFHRVERGVYALQAAAKAGMKAAQAADKAPASRKGPKAAKAGAKPRKRGVFKESAEEMILKLLKDKPMATAEINKAWSKAGRRGVANVTLSELTKDGRLKRAPLPAGQKGSTYVSA